MPTFVRAAAGEVPTDVSDYPVLYHVADRSSVDAQRWYRGLAGAELGLIVVGAATAAVAALVDPTDRLAAIASGISFLGALGARLLIRHRADDRAWFDGRAVAETVKSEVWRYRSKVPPYDVDVTADRVFAAELTATMHARPGLRPSPRPSATQGRQITERMRAAREQPFDGRRDRYRDERLAEQAAWYESKAAIHHRAAWRWSLLTMAVEALAVAVAVAALIVDLEGTAAFFAFFGFCSSSAAAFSAWSHIGRHAEVARAYELAYQELLVMVSLADTVRTEEDLAVLVRDGEGAISREHTMWLAKRAEPLQPADRA